MKVSLNWLAQYVDLESFEVEDLDRLLTFAGVEVEGIEHRGLENDQIVVAQVSSSEKHPDADRLSVCQVDDGSGTPRQIVCGAKNYAVGDKVPLALPGCVLGEGFKIKSSKLRGVRSDGMLCSASELGLAQEADGLLILPAEANPGQLVAELFTPDVIFDLEITPNRTDLLSHLGIAREAAALTERDYRGVDGFESEQRTPAEVATRSATDEEILLEDEERCPYYTARTIRSVKIGPSPDWLCERLEAVGLRPINNVVDITNFVLLETGQPLHAFDLAKVAAPLIIRRAASEECFSALDGERYPLSEDDLVIADTQGALALGGVMGGAESGVTEGTTDILLESAYFAPAAIRRTARRLNLHSDSSYRFERGVDPRRVAAASRRATELIVELAGGSPDESLLESGTAPEAPPAVTLDRGACRRLLGHDLGDEEIDAILHSLGLRLAADGETWDIPSYRLDLLRPVDLIEEVARVYGLDRIPSRYRARFVAESESDLFYDQSRKLALRLTGLGFYETRHIKLISSQEATRLPAQPVPDPEPISLKNPLNDEQDILRPALLPGLLSCAERNRRMGNPDLRLFERGRVFRKDPETGESRESEHLALLLTGAREPRSWHRPRPDTTDLFDLRGCLEALCKPQPVELVPDEDTNLLLACQIRIGASGSVVGKAGLLDPARARELDLEGGAAVAEIDLPRLLQALEQTRRFQNLPRFPAISRDVALEMPLEVANAALGKALSQVEEPLLIDWSLFDVFVDPSGEKLPKDRKSLAYSLIYRADDRTLESQEVDQAHAAILEALRKALPVQIR